MLALAVLLTTLQAAAPAEGTDGHYSCDVSSGEDGRIALTSKFFADGGEAMTFGTWYSREEAGRASLSVHWQFSLGEPRPHGAYVTITVPLRRKGSGNRLLALTRDASTNHMMTLAAPATFVGGGRRATAAVDLQTLLDYSGKEEDLAWRLVRPEPNPGAIESGWLGLSRLRAAVNGLGPLLDQLNARRADFRRLCAWSEGRLEED